MTHNEYTTKYKSAIDRLNRKHRFSFLQRVKEEALRAEFMAKYEGRELSDKAVTEDGRVVE